METPRFTETEGGFFTTEWPGDFMGTFDEPGPEPDDMFCGIAEIDRLRWIEPIEL